MAKWIVVAHRVPLNYHDPESYIVETESLEELAAAQIVQEQLRDLSRPVRHSTYGGKPCIEGGVYMYWVRKYDLPEVKGRIVGRTE